jgi:uncharacterized damage-inducible protein DinB
MRIRQVSLFAVALCALPALRAAEVPAGFRGDFINQLNDVQKKLVSLAEAVPEEKYSWRPTPGVRSIAEVYVHVSLANYGLAGFLGVKPPAGVDRDAEKHPPSKEKIVELIKTSFDHMRNVAANIPDADLDKQVKFFGGKMTSERAVLFLIANHMHEHLGQSIAYARTNGVVPPWSASN